MATFGCLAGTEEANATPGQTQQRRAIRLHQHHVDHVTAVPEHLEPSPWLLVRAPSTTVRSTALISATVSSIITYFYCYKAKFKIARGASQHNKIR